MQLFALPHETVAMLAEHCDRLGLIATVYQPPLSPGRLGRTGDLGDLGTDWEQAEAGQTRIMLHPPCADEAPRWGELVTAKRGWVDISLGTYQIIGESHYLELSAIGAKSDYLEQGVVLEDRRSLELFQKLTRPLKARLHHPMLVRNLVTGGEGTYQIYYSDQAAAFQRAGGELRQAGVRNLRFYPPRAAP